MIQSVLQWSTNTMIPVGKRGFTGEVGKCIRNSDTRANFFLQTAGFQMKMNPTNVEQIIWQYGPIGAYIRDNGQLINYRSGIIEHHDCNVGSLHAIAIVGYRKDYWIIKNSWGTAWGDRGYGYVRKNACKITDRIIFASGIAISR